MEVRIIECIGNVSGDSYWQVQTKRHWWSRWFDFGPMQRYVTAAERIAKVAKKPVIYYPKEVS